MIDSYNEYHERFIREMSEKIFNDIVIQGESAVVEDYFRGCRRYGRDIVMETAIENALKKYLLAVNAKERYEACMNKKGQTMSPPKWLKWLYQNVCSAYKETNNKLHKRGQNGGEEDFRNTAEVPEVEIVMPAEEVERPSEQTVEFEEEQTASTTCERIEAEREGILREAEDKKKAQEEIDEMIAHARAQAAEILAQAERQKKQTMDEARASVDQSIREAKSQCDAMLHAAEKEMECLVEEGKNERERLIKEGEDERRRILEAKADEEVRIIIAERLKGYFALHEDDEREKARLMEKAYDSFIESNANTVNSVSSSTSDIIRTLNVTVQEAVQKLQSVQGEVYTKLDEWQRELYKSQYKEIANCFDTMNRMIGGIENRLSIELSFGNEGYHADFAAELEKVLRSLNILKNSFETTMAKIGIKAFVPAEGTPFNSIYHISDDVDFGREDLLNGRKITKCVSAGIVHVTNGSEDVLVPANVKVLDE